MLNFGKYAAIVAAGLGLAAVTAPQAQAACFMRVSCPQVSMGYGGYGGYGHAFGMYRPAMAYHPVTTYRPVLAYHPVTTYRPVLAYHPVTTYRPAYGYAGGYGGYGYHRPSYGAYGYVPRYHIRPVAFHIYRPPVYGWAAPRIHVIHHVYGAYGYAPRYHAIRAYGCGC